MRNFLFAVLLLSSFVKAEDSSLAGAFQSDRPVSPLASAFGSYMKFTRSVILDDYFDKVGYHLKSVVIQYEGQDVPFDFQLWRIRPKSVCATYQVDILKYSECSQAAAQLFRSACYSESFDQLPKARAGRVRSMFCHAASSYKPIVAKMQPAHEPTDLEKARSACNGAIAIVMGDPTPANQSARDKACEEYNQLKSR